MGVRGNGVALALHGAGRFDRAIGRRVARLTALRQTMTRVAYLERARYPYQMLLMTRG